MLKPFQAFMHEIIDYAGLFPPARLSLNEAIHNYADYRSGVISWMLARFICPAKKLVELLAFREVLETSGTPFRFSVLGDGSKTEAEFFEQLQSDLKAISVFRESLDNRVITDVYETRFPVELQANPTTAGIKSFLDKSASIIEQAGPPQLHMFYEASFQENWEMTFPVIIRGISEHNDLVLEEKKHARYQRAGLKLRCGGAEPRMFPSSDQLAHALELGRNYRVPIKATAGLHHPIRHYSEADKIKMHGFFNVFGAGIFAYAHDLTREELREIIEDENAQNFLFTGKALAWQNLRVSADEIEKIREHGILSFGSCSFDEPKEDLREMKLL